jgi:signal transduction histidine kinase
MKQSAESKRYHHMGVQDDSLSRAAGREGSGESGEALPPLAVGIAILDTDSSISSWNIQAEVLTGRTLEEAKAYGLPQLFEPPEVIQHILLKGQAGIPTLNEYLQLRHADGHLLPVVVQCAPQRHIQQSQCHVVMVFQTIPAHDDNLRRNEHLMVLGRLASSLSHEIRNQLNAVSLHADVLEDELHDLPPDARELLAEPVGDIRSEITRLHDLVENFLSLSRLVNLRREPEDLEAFLTDLSVEWQTLLTPHQIELRLEGLEALGEVRIHPNTFRQLWLNLIRNAIDAMPDGGRLTIQGQRMASHIQLKVSDTGNGIAEDQLPLLFVPFHTTKSDGTGLGLYVVQEILAAHHGGIVVASVPGAGTAFTLTLPLEDTAMLDDQTS